MRYRECLQRVGLVAMLLFSGALGTLMTPLTAEAALDPKTGSYFPPTVEITIEYDVTNSSVQPPVVTHYKTGPVAVNLMATTGTGVKCSTTVPPNETKSDSNTYQYCYALKINDADVYGSGFTSSTNGLTRSGNPIIYGPVAGQADSQGRTAPYSRQFKLQDYDSAHMARLLIADTTSAEKLTLTGLQVIPVPASGDSTWASETAGADGNDAVTVTLTVHNVFNLVPNSTVSATCSTANDCSSTTYYALGLGLIGQFCGNPACNANDLTFSAENDFFTMNGKGTFSKSVGERSLTNTTNPSTRMDFTGISGEPDPKPSVYTWNKTQVTKFPGYVCNNGWSSSNTASIIDPITGTTKSYTSAKCTPDVTENIILTVHGPDTVQLKDSAHHTSGSPPCKGKNQKNCNPPDGPITNDLSEAVEEELALSPNVPAAIDCGPDICDGIIKIHLNVTPAPPAIANMFYLFGSGSFMPGLIPITVDGNGDGDAADITKLRTGEGVLYTISAHYPESYPPVLNSNGTPDSSTIWSIDQFNCTNPDGSVPSGFVRELTTTTTTATFNALPVHALITCQVHAHKATYP